MGFPFDQAVIRLVLDAESDATRWLGHFIPVDPNTPAASLLADSGFIAKRGSSWTPERGLQDRAMLFHPTARRRVG